MTIPLHPDLRPALRKARKTITALTICTRSDGQPWGSGAHFSREFGKMRDKLGLPADLHFHGLRHSAASRLAEAGASDAQIMAITGHKSTAMIRLYTSGARQKVMAISAISKLPRKRNENDKV
jgi:integrase